MADGCRHARFALEVFAGDLITQELRGDYLERNGAGQIGGDCPVGSDTHRAAAQNPGSSRQHAARLQSARIVGAGTIPLRQL